MPCTYTNYSPSNLLHAYIISARPFQPVTFLSTRPNKQYPPYISCEIEFQKQNNPPSHTRPILETSNVCAPFISGTRAAVQPTNPRKKTRSESEK